MSVVSSMMRNERVKTVKITADNLIHIPRYNKSHNAKMNNWFQSPFLVQNKVGQI